MPDAVDMSKVANRRVVSLPDLAALTTEIARLADADCAGKAVTLGNWSVAQIFNHLANLIEFSLDGFPFAAPAPIRWLGITMKRLMFKRFIRMMMKPGFKLPANARSLEPAPDNDLDKARARLESLLARLARGDRMTQPSPILGALTHEQWVYLHLRHAEVHLSFALPRDAGVV